MKRIIYLALTLTIFSCSSLKNTQKKDNTTERTNIERRTFTRPGDTVTINIPNIRYKDTTITRVNYETKQMARVIYDKQGNQQFDCISAEIKETLELIKTIIEKDVTEKEIKKNEFNPQYFIYAIVTLCIVIVLCFGFLYFLFLKVQRSILSLSNQQRNIP